MLSVRGRAADRLASVAPTGTITPARSGGFRDHSRSNTPWSTHRTEPHGYDGGVADPPTSIFVRPATLADAAAIAEIYNVEVVSSTATFDLVERTIEDQREWLANRSGAFAAVVAVDGATKQVVGFAALSPYKPRAAYNTTVENSVYVDRDVGGRGIGALLMRHLIDTARSSGFHSIIARIEARGTASRALHGSVGFELVGIEREVGRKFGRWLDVAVMQLMPSSTAAEPVPER